MPSLSKRLKLWGTKIVPPWRKALKPFRRDVNSPEGPSGAADITKTTLVVLGNAAEPLPPLKAACNGILAILEIAERMKGCKKDARDLLTHCSYIRHMIADSVEDPEAMSPVIKASTAKIENLLGDIEEHLNVIKKRGWIRRLTHLNRQEGSVNGFKQRLEEVLKDISMAATLQSLSMQDVHDKQSKDIQKTVKKIEIQVAGILSVDQLKGGGPPFNRFILIPGLNPGSLQ
ncbi:hypothetical protein C0992_006673 [Termitomyces sp. T32_za158]|nr:hypothetical protein C0992_006673 [Termitomyces sp. T32_za158]